MKGSSKIYSTGRGLIGLNLWLAPHWNLPKKLQEKKTEIPKTGHDLSKS